MSGARNLLSVMTGAGLSLPEAARFISSGRRSRRNPETLTLAVARSLDDTAAVLEAVALDYRHAAAAVRSNG